MEPVELGFVDDVEACYLESHYFPSKVGGKPAWLALDKLPSDELLACKTCGKPCVLLLQVYSPMNDQEDSFHRTIFVFTCKDPECCKKEGAANFMVFRSQLPRNNKYYSEEPPSDKYDKTKEHPSAKQFQDLCALCGCPGAKKCSKCFVTTYCSKEHQILDWKAGHKKVCGVGSDGKSCAASSWLFPELEIVTEPEPESDDEKPDESENVKLRQYADFMQENRDVLEEGGALDDRDLSSMARHETEGDKTFSRFKQRIAVEPTQVLRYQRDGSVLWVNDKGIASETDIPNCEHCGSERRFEFQVLPQLLNHLQVDSLGASLDWGTLAVYTCAKNCEHDESSYLREFLWKQDFSEADERKAL